MKYVMWIYENVFVWVGLGALAVFATIGMFTVIAAPHLRCGVVP